MTLAHPSKLTIRIAMFVTLVSGLFVFGISFGQGYELYLSGARGIGPPHCHGTHILRKPRDKRRLASALGIADYWNYELDHMIPLCLGGADNISNMKFQWWPIARAKDLAETRLCAAVCSGAMTQDAAIKELRSKWP